MSYQGAITLQPGETFQSSGTRKIALCKDGVTAWNSSQSCDYPGPPMKVTVMIAGNTQYDGPFSGSYQWVQVGSMVELFVENIGDTASVMYVHVQ